MQHQENGKTDLADVASSSTGSPLSSISSQRELGTQPDTKNNIIDLEELETDSNGDTVSDCSIIPEELPNSNAREATHQ